MNDFSTQFVLPMTTPIKCHSQAKPKNLAFEELIESLSMLQRRLTALDLHLGCEKFFRAAKFPRFFLYTSGGDQLLDVFLGDNDGVIVRDVIQSFSFDGGVAPAAFRQYDVERVGIISQRDRLR